MMVTCFGGFVTTCYIVAALKFGTNGALFTGVTNALLSMLMITILGVDTQKLKQVLRLIMGDNGGESDELKDDQGQGQ